MDATTKQTLSDIYASLTTSAFQFLELHLMAVAVKNALDENPDFQEAYQRHYRDAKLSEGAKAQFARIDQLQKLSGELRVL